MPYKDPERAKENWRKRYRLRKEKCLCVGCNRKALPGFSRCGYCLYRRALNQKKYYQEHKDRRSLAVQKCRDRYKREGRCIRCGGLRDGENLVCVNCAMVIEKQYPIGGIR